MTMVDALENCHLLRLEDEPLDFIEAVSISFCVGIFLAAEKVLLS